MKVLVIGGGGYIGSRVFQRLMQRPKTNVQRLLSRADKPLSECAIDLVKEPQALAVEMRSFRPDIVVNCAGTISADPRICFESHVMVTANLLTAVAEYAGAARIVQLGSAAEYGQAVTQPHFISETSCPRPVGPYAVSKLASTTLALEQAPLLGLECIALRVFNLIGPSMALGTIIPNVMRYLDNPMRQPDDPVDLGPLGVYRDFVHVDDVVSAIVAAVHMPIPTAGAIVNIASGEAILVRNLVRWMLEEAGHRGEIREVDGAQRVPLVWAGSVLTSVERGRCWAGSRQGRRMSPFGNCFGVIELDDVRKPPLVVGPRPPPAGGIATIMANLAGWPGVADSVQFLNTTKREDGGYAGRLLRPLHLLTAVHGRLRECPECVLVFSSAYGSFWEKGVWLMLSRHWNVPMSVMMVDGNFPRFYGSLSAPLRKVARLLLERFSTVIVQSHSWLRFYREIAPRGNYIVLSNGVDCDEFTPRQRKKTGRPLLLFVGWLIREKGIFDLVEAVRVLRDQGLNFGVTVVGPYHGNEGSLRASIAEAKLEGVVDLIGPVHGRDAIQTLYRDADIYVLPSWAEGLPVAMLEAMACALPVVATRVGGIPDAVEEGVSGLLVPAQAPQALANALTQLIQDEGLRLTMGNAARSRVETAFSNNDFIAGLLALLRAHGRIPQ